jgi:MFS superfamily sulfate permease-like transporter
MNTLNSESARKSARFPHLSEDFFASIVVFLVALPLCIGIAVAVGVNPARALITGIIGGIVVGALAGSPLQVSGPAAGLFVIVADMLSSARARFLADTSLESLDAAAAAAVQLDAENYALKVLGASVLLAGVLQLVAGKCGLARWFRAVSPAVIKGMLAGIGALILISQLHVMFDNSPTWYGKPAQGGVQHIGALPDAFRKVFDAENQQHMQAAIIGVVTIALLALWPKLAPKRLRLLPGSLIAVVVAAIAVGWLGLPILKLSVPSNFTSEVTLPGTDFLSILFDPAVILGGIVIAVVASAETLLCATAVDQMQSGPRTDYARELTSQGVGNFLCGVLGALPMTGVIVRSSANVQAGARTRLSTILHGAWLLMFVAVIPGVLNYIPKAALGAMLVYTGYKLLHIKEARKLWKLDKGEAAIFFATTAIIIGQDLLLGVMVGVSLSALKLLYTFTHLKSELVVSPDGSEARLKLSGSATFVRLPIIAQDLESVPPGAELHVELHDLAYVDHACLDLFMNWAKQHESTGGSLSLDWDSLNAKFQRGGELIAKKARPKPKPELVATR